ncbi:hypothetical protein GGD83_002066 [Rhodoblastus sphagnicola]|nr:hypothetical protein [Rhodoblastus sphagnicola]MBB4198266.1 hypothetical protein [Rhodoblastus sphagnicola]
MEFKHRLIVSAAVALSFCGSIHAACASSKSLPGISAGAITSAPLPDGIYNLIDVSWGQRGPYQGSAETDSLIAVPLHFVGFLPFRVLEGHPFFESESVWAQVTVGRGFGTTEANLDGFAAQKFGAGLSWDLGGGFFGAIKTGAWIPVNTSVSLSDYWVSQTNVAVGYVANGWALNADLAYGTGKTGAEVNVTPVNAALGQPATAGNAYGVLNLTALRHIEKWEVGLIGFGSQDVSSPYPGYLKQSQFALGGLVGYDFGSIKADFRVSRDIAQTNMGGFETRYWARLIIPVWKFDQPAVTAVAAKY